MAPPYRPGGYIPQQDGAADMLTDKLEVKTTYCRMKVFVFCMMKCYDFCLVSQVGQGSNSQPGQGIKLTSLIPQLDGPIPDPYDDALSTPNVRMRFFNVSHHL